MLARAGDRVVGVAELAPDGTGPGRYEAAVVVADDWRRRGVARALLRDLGARFPGAHVVAHVQHDNVGALRLAGDVAPTADRHLDDGVVIELAVPRPRRAAHARSSTSSYPARRHAM